MFKTESDPAKNSFYQLFESHRIQCRKKGLNDRLNANKPIRIFTRITKTWGRILRHIMTAWSEPELWMNTKFSNVRSIFFLEASFGGSTSGLILPLDHPMGPLERSTKTHFQKRIKQTNEYSSERLFTALIRAWGTELKIKWNAIWIYRYLCTQVVLNFFLI